MLELRNKVSRNIIHIYKVRDFHETHLLYPSSSSSMSFLLLYVLMVLFVKDDGEENEEMSSVECIRMCAFFDVILK